MNLLARRFWAPVLCGAWAVWLGTGGVLAQNATADAPAQPKAHWATSAGLNRYTESLMQLQGPELGLHLTVTGWASAPRLAVEADGMLGRQRYDSPISGGLDNVSNIETRWRVLYNFSGPAAEQAGFSAGLALHTLWNDLRGSTSTGSSGYVREAFQLWAPVRWHHLMGESTSWALPASVTLDAGALLLGQHTSYLSQTGTSYVNITNSQKSGAYAQASASFSGAHQVLWTPFVRLTWLDNSNTQLARTNPLEYWLEPTSQRWQLGLRVDLP